MRIAPLAGLAAAAVLAALVAGPAAAAITITVYNTDLPLPAGQLMVEDFDHPLAAGFSFTQNAGAYVRSGALGLDPGISAPPPGDTSNYETVLSGGLATLTSTRALRAFSFYLGSPDSWNTVRFYGTGGLVASLSGAQIWGSTTGDNGDQGWGRRVSYDFGGAVVNKIEFASSGNSFEFDSLAAAPAPEPAVWAMMILGLGTVGAALRRRRVAALA